MNEKLIEIKQPKGCSLYLTKDEYTRAIKRGKGIKRHKAATERNPAGCGKKCRCSHE